jgi:hypothetical protein
MRTPLSECTQFFYIILVGSSFIGQLDVTLVGMFAIGSHSASATVAQLASIKRQKRIKKLQAQGIDVTSMDLSSVASDSLSKTGHTSSSKSTFSKVTYKASNLSKSLNSIPMKITCDSTTFRASSSSTMWLRSKLEKAKAKALQVIQQSIDREHFSQQIVRRNLVNAAAAAIARYECHNERGAALSMKKFQAYKAEYEKSACIIDKLYHLYDQVSQCDDDGENITFECIQKQVHYVEKDYKTQVQSILETPPCLSPATDDANLMELMSGMVAKYVDSLP